MRLPPPRGARTHPHGVAGFFYNAIFFTYALVLSAFYGVADERVGYYIFPFALGNFLGPLLLGHLFDTVGRRVMIAFTYGVAGLLAAGYAFQQEWLSATTQALAWSAIFFVASAAASSAYLTVSEVFLLRCARSPSRFSTRSEPRSAASSARRSTAR